MYLPGSTRLRETDPVVLRTIKFGRVGRDGLILESIEEGNRSRERRRSVCLDMARTDYSRINRKFSRVTRVRHVGRDLGVSSLPVGTHRRRGTHTRPRREKNDIIVKEKQTVDCLPLKDFP